MLARHAEQLKAIHGKKLDAGWLESAISAEGIKMAQIAMWNEYGHTTRFKKGNMFAEAIFVTPARPFMRLAADNARKQIYAVTAKIAGKIVDGQITAEQGLNLIGEFFVGEIVMSIKSGNWLPNSDITVHGTPPGKDGTQFIEGKGFNRPLINTAAMWQSASYKVY
jgi:hypothetical protein